MWQPIETAPKDGRFILATDGKTVDVIWWCDIGTRAEWVASLYDWIPGATHWMPLPNPSAQEEVA